MRRTILTGVLAVVALLAPSLAQPAMADDHDPVFAEGGVMAGSTNGMSFAPDGTLWVANVFGQTITQIDPDTGEILSRLTAADGVLFPDDVVVGSDGTIYWTDPVIGMVFKRPPGGPSIPLLEPMPIVGLNGANPLTLSDDGSRLFAAGCYGAPPLDNSFVEIDPVGGGITNTIFGPVPLCASNGMSWNDGFLYAPQPFLDQVWRIDPDVLGGNPTPVTTGWSVPIGTAFDSNGELYALAQGDGEVVRIDVSNPDTAGNRTVIAEIPVGWADNIAINSDDRIFISSASDSTVAEVLPDGSLRTVVPGQFQLPNGVAVVGGTVYTTNLGGLWGFDRDSRELTSVLRAPFGVTNFPPATGVVAWRNRPVLISAFTSQVVIWNPKTNTPVAATVLFAPPIDAEPYRGDLLVTLASGDIVRLTKTLDLVEVVANVPGAAGLAKRGQNVYVSVNDAGTVVQIIRRGNVLATPVVVADGLAGPEGIDAKGRELFVVEGASETLTKIDLRNGKRTTVATNLGFQVPPPLSPFGWFNDVTVAGEDVYVNADRTNVIYEFELDDDNNDD